MIIQFNQIKRQPDPIFIGDIHGEAIISGRGATRDDDGYILYNNQKISISSKIHKEQIKGKTATQVTDFTMNGLRIGYAYPSLVPKKKILFFSIGYDYFEYCFNNEFYQIYEVGLGDDQHYFCVYQNNNTVAIIHKKDKVVNFKNMYTIYALDGVNVLAMCALTLYFDCIMAPDYNEYSGYSQIDEAYITTQKELNEKYDATFIAKIIEQEKNKNI